MTSFVERQREAAVAQVREWYQRQADVRDALHLSRGERLGETIDLDDAVTVAEVEGGSFGTVWRVVVNGKATHMGYTSRWLAILAAVGEHYDAGESASTYAARVLRVPADEH